MLSHKDSDKARQYLDLLDAARCNARWQEIPELVRKIEKHAPSRQCLCLTAQTEQRVAIHASQRPSTSSSLTSTSLSEATAPLLAAIENERAFPEDRFQAQVCLAWLHSILDEQPQVLSKLPAHDIVQAVDQFTNIVSPTARWTHVCIVKGACLRGMALESVGNVKEAFQSYESMLPYLQKTESTVGNTFQANAWTERLLARHASLVSRHVQSNINNPNVFLKSKTIQPTSLLGPFRVWSHYRADRQSGPFFTLTWIWKAYYDLLSILVQHQILKPIFQSKLTQREELQKTQAAYEAIIMREMSFPQANQSNVEIDSWVDQVMANWRAMLASFWQEEDLGRGGNAALGKTVLDILYKAATRTFHSTRILRHLFIVHAQLGEFDLARKALDTYLEVVAKGKARVEKSGEYETGLDDDATALCTAAAGITMLCVYGKRAETERALQIADVLQNWLSKARADSLKKSQTSAEDSTQDLAEREDKPKSTNQDKASALAYHAIGISQSCWARLTYETSARSDLTAKAISNFRHALLPEVESQANIEVLYSLAYAFAEARDIDSAITTVKEAISIGSEEEPSTNGHLRHDAGVTSAHRGTLLRCWHLLALLLSARQNFATAIASCEAAFESYGGKAVLYGDTSGLNAITGLSTSERKGLIELKMTQLALSEVIDGPDEAVNSCGELLGLYANLFKYTEKGAPATLEPNREIHTSNTDSPQRSFRGSILGYPKDRMSKLAIGGTANTSVGSFEPSNEATRAPAIAITSDNTILPQNPNYHNHFLGRHESNKLKKRNSRKSLQGTTRRISRAGSPLRPSTSDDGGHRLPIRNRLSTDVPAKSHSPFPAHNYAADEVGVAISHDLPSTPPTPAAEPSNPINNIPSTTQNMDRKNLNTYPITPKPSSASPPRSISLFAASTLPEPHYPPHLQTRHALTLLTQIWCHISALYRRAGLASDAQGAIREATIHIQAIETAIASREGSSAESFSSPGYGGLKSLGELWGDVLAETGALHGSLGETTKASNAYETALSWHPDHAGAIVGLSAILLDSYETARAAVDMNVATKASTPNGESKTPVPPQVIPTLASLPLLPSANINSSKDQTTAPRPDLTTLSARDRAFNLLSILTKSGPGWDDSEAWFALSRAYELGGQIERAKDALWWVVELEEGRGIRRWKAGAVV